MQVAKLANFIEPVAEAAVSAASKMPHSQKQTDLLDQTKTVAESATELLYAVKDAGGNPKVVALCDIVVTSSQRDLVFIRLCSCRVQMLTQ